MPTDPPKQHTPSSGLRTFGVVVLGAIIGLSTIPGIWITALGTRAGPASVPSRDSRP